MLSLSVCERYITHTHQLLPYYISFFTLVNLFKPLVTMSGAYWYEKSATRFQLMYKSVRDGMCSSTYVYCIIRSI